MPTRSLTGREPRTLDTPRLYAAGCMTMQTGGGRIARPGRLDRTRCEDATIWRGLRGAAGRLLVQRPPEERRRDDHGVRGVGPDDFRPDRHLLHRLGRDRKTPLPYAGPVRDP